MIRQINILDAKHIDKKKWDHCVAMNTNGLIYSTTPYLDAMTQNWHGVVVDNYAAVMALPWKRKLGIRYGYTPAFIQQLGIIGHISKEDLSRILKLIYRFVALADIHFNFENTTIQQLLPVIPRNNFVIELLEGYTLIRSRYKNNLIENIRKASNESLAYATGEIKEGISMYHSQYRSRLKHTHEKDYRHFSELCELLYKKDQCFARTARNHQNEILAIAVFLKDQRRIYNIMNTTTQEGRQKEANHFLLNHVIHEFAGLPLVFDFEGSELPGVREFYEGFGGKSQPYFHYHYNGYTWPARLLNR